MKKIYIAGKLWKPKVGPTGTRHSLHTSRSGAHLLEYVLVVYVLEHCDEARQLVLHLVLRHSLRRFLEEVVTVFGQLDGRTGVAGKDKKVETRLSRALVAFSGGKKKNACTVCFFARAALTSSGALQMDFGSLKFTTDVSA